MARKFKIGQKVKINPVSESEKFDYPWGWVDEMDKYVGQIVTILDTVDGEYPVIDEEAWGNRGNPECYTVEENTWTWAASNLSLVEEKSALMRRFALYHPSSDQYVSCLSYNRKTNSYEIEFTRNLHSIRLWNTKASAESQAQRVFGWNRNIALEVREIR